MSLDIVVESTLLNAALGRMREATSDLRPVFEEIGAEMEARIRRRFESKKDPLGLVWAPWRPATVKSYPRGGNGTLLDRTGDLIDHLSHTASATSVVVGFAEPYAEWHEFGTKKMVRRGLLFADPESGTLAPEDERALIDVVADYLERAID